MSEDPNPSTIRVTDRRHFNRDGGRRSEAEEAQEPSAGEGAGAGPRPPEPPKAPRPSQTGAPPGPRASAGAVGPERERLDAEEIRRVALGVSGTFGYLVARLAAEAEIYLGLRPYPGTESAEPDLEAAKLMIDTLAMLQDKTRENLDNEESRFLEECLYALRLEFVRVRSGGEAR